MRKCLISGDCSKLVALHMTQHLWNSSQVEKDFAPPALAVRSLTQQHRRHFCPPGAPGKREVRHRGHGGDRLQRPGCHDRGPEGHLLLQRWLHHHLRLWLAQQAAGPHLRHQRKLLFLRRGCSTTRAHTTNNISNDKEKHGRLNVKTSFLAGWWT